MQGGGGGHNAKPLLLCAGQERRPGTEENFRPLICVRVELIKHNVGNSFPESVPKTNPVSPPLIERELVLTIFP